jgi:hypothetical protein
MIFQLTCLLNENVYHEEGRDREEDDIQRRGGFDISPATQHLSVGKVPLAARSWQRPRFYEANNIPELSPLQ